LAAQGVVLIGVDVPSVDVLDSKDLPIHHALGRHGIAIVENLVLTEVPRGIYELIALPLKLVGADGAPVRAVLREMHVSTTPSPAGVGK
jgi:arylformamidase